jgi:hypothetical protein
VIEHAREMAENRPLDHVRDQDRIRLATLLEQHELLGLEPPLSRSGHRRPSRHRATWIATNGYRVKMNSPRFSEARRVRASWWDARPSLRREVIVATSGTERAAVSISR